MTHLSSITYIKLQGTYSFLFLHINEYFHPYNIVFILKLMSMVGVLHTQVVEYLKTKLFSHQASQNNFLILDYMKNWNYNIVIKEI